jgi:nucleoside-diphosphate-sugar epimerase
VSVLVIGGAGFIGSGLVTALRGKGNNAVPLDVRPHPSIPTIEFDIRSACPVTREISGCTAVYYLAGYTSNAFQRDPESGMLLELQGIAHSVAAARELGASSFVYASSFLVYSGLPDHSIGTEETLLPFEHATLFGAGKLFLERYARVLCAGAKIRYVCCRIGSTYGADRRCTNMVHQFLADGLQKRIIEVWGTGARQSQLTYLGDVVEGLARCLMIDESMVVNLCDPVRTSVRDLTELLTRKYGFSFSYDQGRPDPASGPYVDSSRARAMLDWSCRSLEEGLDQTWQELQETVR